MRKSKQPRIRITRFGIVFYLTQTLISIAIMAWTIFDPPSFLANVTRDVSAPLIFAVVGVFGCIVSFLLQRRGIVFAYKSIPPQQ